MTAEIRNQDTVRSPWLWRKAAYFVIGGVLGVLALLGWVSMEQVESTMDLLERAMPTIGAIALLFAGTKTTHGSDDQVTEQDVRDAAAAAGAASVASANRGMLEEVLRKLDGIAPGQGLTGMSSQSASGPGRYPVGE